MRCYLLCFIIIVSGCFFSVSPVSSNPQQHEDADGMALKQLRADHKNITLKKKPHSTKLALHKQEKTIAGTLYFVETEDTVSKKSDRIWQEFVTIVSPQEVPRDFVLSVAEPEKTMILAYIKGFAARFHVIDLAASVVPYEEGGQQNQQATRLTDNDPSSISIPRLLGREFNTYLAENPPRIKEAKKGSEGWECVIEVGDKRMTFLRKFGFDAWSLLKQGK